MVSEKEKIGILTFHASNNYGAVLQTYALKKTLQDIYPQFHVGVIDYRGKGTTSSSKIRDIYRKKGIIGGTLHYHQIKSMAKRFDVFRHNYLNLSEQFTEAAQIREVMKSYRAIVSGSDQVWNLKVSKGDTTYFQDFHQENKKKYSYAASIGTTSISDDSVDIYKKYLPSFTWLSVRENSAKELLESILERSVIQNVDPTLLLDKDDWDKIAKKPNIRKGYILVYMVPKQENIIQYAIQLRKRTGLQIVMLSKNLLPMDVIHKGNSSPEEFVGLFRDAEYVLTNSFHGTAFACIYKKNLWADLQSAKGFNTRIESLVKLHGLEKCIEHERFVSIARSDWKESRENLDKEINNSKGYLRKMIGNATED